LIIGLDEGDPIPWSPRSPDLTTLNFEFWNLQSSKCE
jgi:hypothetical protein